MEAPALSATTAATVPQPQTAPPSHLPYPDSVDSSPRSRNTDSWDEPPLPHPSYVAAIGGGSHSFKLRLMCSYGGHIFPRPHDKSLCYVGGETRMIVVDRQSTLSDLHLRLSKNFLGNSKSFTLKYQLPNEDLDSLISVTTDEDLENMIEEYDRLTTTSAASSNPQKCPRLRLFLFPDSSSSIGSIDSILESSVKSEDWFLNALNNGSTSTRGLSESSSVNCLLGLEEENPAISNSNSSEKDVEAQVVELKGVSNTSSHSVSDLPTLETTSSFGSTSSSPLVMNLPPVRVRAEDLKMVGVEEQFSHMSVVGSGAVKNNANGNIQQQKLEDGGLVGLSSPPTVFTSVATPAVTTGVPLGSGMVVGDYSSRVLSDDEKLDHGVPVAYGVPSLQPQLQLQQKAPSSHAVDYPSPDSVSSDGSAANPLSRQKPMMYQDTIVQTSIGNTVIATNPVDPKTSDLNTRAQMQAQMYDSGYLLSSQIALQHQQSSLQQQSQQQQQQYVHTGAQFVPTGAMPMFYSVYPSHQQHHPHHTALGQQYPVYYVQAGQAQGYSLPLQQPNYNDTSISTPSSRPQAPHPTNIAPHTATYNNARNSPANLPEGAGGMYMTATTVTPQLIQMPGSQNQQQYLGLSQIPHHAQSIAPTSAASPNYSYEYADPTRAQVYYPQHVASQMAAQYQTMTPSVSLMLPESASQFSADNTKQQQTRPLQP